MSIFLSMVLVGMFLAAGLFLISRGVARDTVRRLAEDQLSRLLEQQVTIGSLATNLFSRVELHDVRICRDPETAFLRLEKARATYDLFSFLSGPFRVHRVELEGVNVQVLRVPGGYFNTPLADTTGTDTAATDTGSFPDLTLPFMVNRLDLSGGRFAFIDTVSAGLSIEVHDIAIGLDRRSEQAYGVDLTTGTGQVCLAGIILPVRGLSLRGEYGPTQWQVDSVALDLPDERFTARGTITPAVDFPARLAGRLYGDPGKMLDLLRPFTGVRITANGTQDLYLRLERSLVRPAITVDAVFPPLQLAGHCLSPARLQAVWDGDSLALHEFSSGYARGRFRAAGKLAADSSLFADLQLTVSELSLTALRQVFFDQPVPFDGTISGTVDLKGSLRQPERLQIRTGLAVRRMRYQNAPLPDLALNLSAGTGRAQLDLRQQENKVTADVAFDRQGLDGTFSVHLPRVGPLAALINRTELAGSVELTGSVTGPWSAPSFTAGLQARNIVYRDFPLDRLDGRVTLQDRALIIHDLGFEGQLADIDTVNPPFNLTGLSGGIQYQGLVSGMAGAVIDLAGTVRAELSRPGYKGIAFNQGTVEIEFHNDRVRVTSAELKQDDYLVRAAGEMTVPDLQGACSLSVARVRPYGGAEMIGQAALEFDAGHADDIRLTLNDLQLDLEPTASLLPGSLAVGGTLSLRGAFSGRPDDPSVSCQISVIGPWYDRVRADSLNAIAVLENHVLQVRQLELFQGSSVSFLSVRLGLVPDSAGAFGVGPASPFSGTARTERIDLSLVRPFIPDSTAIKGNCSINLQWHGTWGRPIPSGFLGLTAGYFALRPDAPPVEALQVRAALSDTMVLIDDCRGTVQGTPFSITGQVATASWESFGFSVRLNVAHYGSAAAAGLVSAQNVEAAVRVNDIDLAVFQPFVPAALGLTGVLTADLALGGRLEDPRLDGQLAASGLGFGVPGLPDPFGQGLLKARFDFNTVWVETLALGLAGGTINASGLLTHDQGRLQAADLRVDAHDITVRKPKAFILALKTGRLHISDVPDGLLVEGDLVLGDSRLLVSFGAQDFLKLVRTQAGPQPELPRLLETMRLNVRIHDSPDLWLDNNLGKVRVSPVVSVVGTPAAPNLSGRLTIEKGYLLFMDRKFRFTKGIIDFTDPHRLNPVVDIQSESIVRQYQSLSANPYTVHLDIHGPLDEVVVDLTCEPPLDKPDIMALLAVGATRAQLTAGETESGLTGVLKERVESLTSQKLAGYISRNVGSLLGLDQFSIEGNLFKYDKDWGPQLVASKKVSQRMELTYTAVVGHANDQQIKLEYRLTDTISLEGQTDQQGRAGLDLKYGLKFP